MTTQENNRITRNEARAIMMLRGISESVANSTVAKMIGREADTYIRNEMGKGDLSMTKAINSDRYIFTKKVQPVS